MIVRVTVRTADTPPADHNCALGGFGAVICGNCNTILKSTIVGTHCTGCGAAVVDVQRVGDRFEGEAW
jgi:hypothetical protein